MTIEGGSALPVSIDEDANPVGGPALRVYGYTPATVDRPIEGGPARRVKVLTSADLVENGGAWRVEGRVHALPVVNVDDGRVVEGGPAIAIYPVNGSEWPVTPEPPFSPADLPGYAIDVDSMQASGGVDGQPLETWNDVSGNGHDFTQATVSRQFIYYGSGGPLDQAVLVCDGIDDYMTTPDAVDIELNTDSTVYFVGKAFVGTVGTILAKDAGAASPGAYAYYLLDNGKFQFDRPFIDGAPPSTNPIPDDTYSIAVLRISGTAVRHRLNGAVNGSSTLVTGNATNQPLRLGALFTSNLQYYWSGEMLRVIVYNQAHTDDQVAQLETYLSDYTGVAI